MKNNKITLYRDYNTNEVDYAKIDNHTDTCCFGSNFRPTFITDQVCQVHSYHESYKVIPDVPVIIVCTAYDDSSLGQTYIITIHQGLCFGKSTKNSLLSPKQIRSYGISLYDDPYNPYMSLCMELRTDKGELFEIPFEIKGSFFVFKKRVPTDTEIRNYKYIMLTKKEAEKSLKIFNEDVGVPNHITVDDTKAHVSHNTEFVRKIVLRIPIFIELNHIPPIRILPKR